jgi:hypothetical protein
MTRCKAALAFRFVLLAGFWLANSGAADALQPDVLTETRARPLFAPTRRPPPRPQVSEPVAAVDVHAAPPNLRLVGVVFGSTIKRAILQRPPDLETFGVAPGDEIDGWEVTRIELRQIVIGRDSQSIMIDLGAP